MIQNEWFHLLWVSLRFFLIHGIPDFLPFTRLAQILWETFLELAGQVFSEWNVTSPVLRDFSYSDGFIQTVDFHNTWKIITFSSALLLRTPASYLETLICVQYFPVISLDMNWEVMFPCFAVIYSPLICRFTLQIGSRHPLCGYFLVWTPIWHLSSMWFGVASRTDTKEIRVQERLDCMLK